MPFDSIIWDLDDDPEGNVQHCASTASRRKKSKKCSRMRRTQTSAGRLADPSSSETPARAGT